ncbi:hypothetical protein PIB30_024279, partial [Stylosanthes scabra]|nr:hypothetical protein [Stylosanthes scabra]
KEGDENGITREGVDPDTLEHDMPETQNDRREPAKTKPRDESVKTKRDELRRGVTNRRSNNKEMKEVGTTHKIEGEEKGAVWLRVGEEKGEMLISDL